MENDDIKQTKETENYKTLTFDADYYQGFLDDADIPNDQKREFLETLWNIMVQFVDMGFGIEATQLATDCQTLEASPQESTRKTIAKEEINTCL